MSQKYKYLDNINVGVSTDGKISIYKSDRSGKLIELKDSTNLTIESVFWFMKRNDMKEINLFYHQIGYSGKPTIFATDDPEKVKAIERILKNV